MGLQTRKKANKKVICGRGYCTCKKGKGLTDVALPVIDIVKDNKGTIENVVSLADSTKAIASEIMKKYKKPDKLQNIVDKLNKLKVGSGFAYA